MSLLDALCAKHGTDKASTHPVKGHGYANFYAQFFAPLYNFPLKLLEIGVGGGESVKVWLEYFPQASVVGTDITQDTNEWNDPGKSPDPRYAFVQGPQESETFWACFLADRGKDWDIIIDDGGHFNDGVITSFKCLWPALKPGALYCIEDLGVAYSPGSVFIRSGFKSHVDWMREKVDELHQGPTDIEEIHLFKELAIFRKKDGV